MDLESEINAFIHSYLTHILQ